MYICICHAVTDSTIRKVVQSGASSISELSFKTGCGTQCGSCVSEVRKLINEVLAQEGRSASRLELSVVSSS